ncbi:orotidine-5'-phosphate decarboxylase [Exiguobacterium flavidum]|uniref:orotidine-5'-phosphate decarboxylase n=1 Tax=Exiguobacterium flavidum TaxID=2184695 RepID=UPI000DF74AE1|nr:orotidine-5'-phosphate decarboxylase [Exiguobacterium flavidum]
MDIYIALDFQDRTEVESFLAKFGDEKPAVKVGMELYYKEGAAFVRELSEKGHEVFLDLKVHDIPETARRTMRVIGSLGVALTNVHATGGTEMMRAAKQGLEEAGARTKLIAVTQLTSSTQSTLTELMIDAGMHEVITAYAKQAKLAGLDGVVCSALDAKIVHEACGEDFLIVTPGIRMTGDAADDQKRIATPAIARKNGAKTLVVGRPITRALDPVEAYSAIMKEWEVNV